MFIKDKVNNGVWHKFWVTMLVFYMNDPRMHCIAIRTARNSVCELAFETGPDVEKYYHKLYHEAVGTVSTVPWLKPINIFQVYGSYRFCRAKRWDEIGQSYDHNSASKSHVGLSPHRANFDGALQNKRGKRSTETDHETTTSLLIALIINYFWAERAHGNTSNYVSSSGVYSFKNNVRKC